MGWPINFKNGREMCRVASPSGYILCIGVLPQILYIVEYLLSTHVGVGFTPTIVGTYLLYILNLQASASA